MTIFDRLNPGDFVSEFLVFTVVFLIVIPWWRKKLTSRDDVYSYPPGPYRLPLIGNLLGLKDGERYLARLALKYGDVCTIHMGNIPVVVVNSTAAADELMSDPNLFNERAPTPVLNDYFKGRGLVGAHYLDGYWEPQRKFVSKVLNKLSGIGYRSLESKLLTEVDYLRNLIRQRANGRPLDVLKPLQLSCANFIWVLTLGERLSHDDPFQQRAVSLLYDVLRSIKYVTASLIFPALLCIPGNSVSKMFSYLDQLYAVLAEKISSYRKKGSPSSEDFVGLFHQEMDKFRDDPSKAPDFLNEDNLRFVMQDLLMAGVDTTSVTLTWAILYLIRHPALQQRAYDDIRRVTRDGERVSISDIKDLPYIDALLLETLRTSAVVPIIAKSNIRDFRYKGHLIPKGTWFLFNFYNFSRTESLWSDPTAFNPERFIDENGQFVARKDIFKPFGFGRRVCLGEKYAMRELFLILSNLIKDFEFLAEDEANPPSLEAVCSIMRTPQPYKVRIRDRSQTISPSGRSNMPTPLMRVQSNLPIDCGVWSHEVRAYI